jgi:hypothetical protein
LNQPHSLELYWNIASVFQPILFSRQTSEQVVVIVLDDDQDEQRQLMYACDQWRRMDGEGCCTNYTESFSAIAAGWELKLNEIVQN